MLSVKSGDRRREKEKEKDKEREARPPPPLSSLGKEEKRQSSIQLAGLSAAKQKESFVWASVENKSSSFERRNMDARLRRENRSKRETVFYFYFRQHFFLPPRATFGCLFANFPFLLTSLFPPSFFFFSLSLCFFTNIKNRSTRSSTRSRRGRSTASASPSSARRRPRCRR